MENPFFKKDGPFTIKELLQSLDIESNEEFLDIKITDIKDLVSAEKENITFFHSKKYETFASKTKATFCIPYNKAPYKKAYSLWERLINHQSERLPKSTALLPTIRRIVPEYALSVNAGSRIF